jgi:hypothetical protein
MERLNKERRDAFLCGESQIGRTSEEISRLDMAGSFHGVLMSTPNAERAIDLFRRVYKTTLAPIDSDAAAGYLKLITNALNSNDPVSSPVLRNSTVVRFLSEAAVRWGSVRERRCAKTILENHYDFNKNEFVDTPNKPLVDYADDTPTMPTAHEEDQLPAEIRQLFPTLEAAEDAIRARELRSDSAAARINKKKSASDINEAEDKKDYDDLQRPQTWS